MLPTFYLKPSDSYFRNRPAFFNRMASNVVVTKAPRINIRQRKIRKDHHGKKSSPQFPYVANLLISLGQAQLPLYLNITLDIIICSDRMFNLLLNATYYLSPYAPLS